MSTTYPRLERKRMEERMMAMRCEMFALEWRRTQEQVAT